MGPPIRFSIARGCCVKGGNFYHRGGLGIWDPEQGYDEGGIDLGIQGQDIFFSPVWYWSDDPLNPAHRFTTGWGGGQNNNQHNFGFDAVAGHAYYANASLSTIYRCDFLTGLDVEEIEVKVPGGTRRPEQIKVYGSIGKLYFQAFGSIPGNPWPYALYEMDLTTHVVTELINTHVTYSDAHFIAERIWDYDVDIYNNHIYTAQQKLRASWPAPRTPDDPSSDGTLQRYDLDGTGRVVFDSDLKLGFPPSVLPGQRSGSIDHAWQLAIESNEDRDDIERIWIGYHDQGTLPDGTSPTGKKGRTWHIGHLNTAGVHTPVYDTNLSHEYTGDRVGNIFVNHDTSPAKLWHYGAAIHTGKDEDGEDYSDTRASIEWRTVTPDGNMSLKQRFRPEESHSYGPPRPIPFLLGEGLITPDDLM